ncbi:hypothetical protein SESBI_48729 [Sesbania bispinosa]|nr:hypothetical protein SESBI_48729 [Sesbania bispinosa]
MTNPPPNREIKVGDIANGIGYWFIKGEKIQGTIPVDVFNSTNFGIAEEGYYKIGRVQVVNNDGQERATAHPFRLLFSQRSLVKPWQPKSFSSSFGLTPFTVAQIRTYKNELEQFVDIVGLCTSISSERVHFLDGRIVNVVLLEITDETNGMRRTVVVLQFTKMVPFHPASFGNCVIQIIPNVTRLLFNPPIDEVFEEYDRLLTHGIDLISPLWYVLIDRVDVDMVDDFLFSFRRKEVRELLFQAKAGRYIVLATLGSIIGNDQWWELYSECQKRGFRGHPLGYSYDDKKFLPRYNLKAQVFDGHHRLNLLLSDHNVMKVLVKYAKQGCGHTLTDNDWLRVRNVCGDPEILRVFVDRDYYSLDIMTKAKIHTTLRKYVPLDDSFLTLDRRSGVGVSELLIGHDVGETSSSACGVEYPIGDEKPISRSSDLQPSES